MSEATTGLIAECDAIYAAAANAARGYFRDPLKVEFKPDESPVTLADQGVEQIVRDMIAAHHPEDGIFGEEHGAAGLDQDDLWIIDPIDGTRSFISGHPLFGFLLAKLHRQRPEIGVIGMPALEELFIGVPGQGAWLNGAAIHCSDVTALSDAVLYINEGERIYKARPAVFDTLMNAGQTRRLSYDCYPYGLLAAGHVDAVVDYGLEPYDYFPLIGVIEGAGGIITDWDGAPLTLQSDVAVVAAATPALHREMLALLNGAAS